MESHSQTAARRDATPGQADDRGMQLRDKTNIVYTDTADEACSVPAKSAARPVRTCTAKPKPAAKKKESSEALEKVDSFKRSLVRYLMRNKRCRGHYLFGELAETLNKPSAELHKLWHRLRGVSLQKLSCLVRAGDVANAVEKAATLEYTDWRVLDFVMLYDDDFRIITEESVRLYEQLRPLISLFHVVQACRVEEAPTEQRRQEAWLHAELEYKKTGKRMSLVGLQRRWVELKKCTADSFLKYWQAMLQGRNSQSSRARLRMALDAAGEPPPHNADSTDQERKNKVDADKLKPPYLYVAIARRYGHVVTQPLPEWTDLVAQDKIVISLEHFKRRWGCTPELPSATFVQVPGDAPPSNIVPEADDDIILVEREIETIDLDEFDEEERRVLREEKRTEDLCGLLDINPAEGAITKVIIDSDNDDDFNNEDLPNDRINSIDKEISDLTMEIHREILQFDQPALGYNSNIKINQEKYPVEQHNDLEVVETSIATTLENTKNKLLTNPPSDTRVDILSNTENVNKILEDFGITNADSNKTNDNQNKYNDDRTSKINKELSDLRMAITREIIVKKEVETIDKEPNTETMETARRGSDESETDLININEAPADDNDSTCDPEVDMKLFLFPTVPLTRIDDTRSWNRHSLNNSIDVTTIDKNEVEPERRLLEKSPDIDDSVKQELIDMTYKKEIIETTKTSVMNVSTHPLEPARLIILKSDKYRSYTPISLCKNPDFNTRLKRLPVSFLLSRRNKDLIRQCIPLTIDVEKTELPEHDEDDDVEEIPETIDLDSEGEAPKPRVTKKIELPDINDVRKINKGILTAEVNPINVDLSRIAQASPLPAPPADEPAEQETHWSDDPSMLRYLKKTNSLACRGGERYIKNSPWTLNPRIAWTRDGAAVITHRAARVSSAVSQYVQQTGDTPSAEELPDESGDSWTSRNVAVRGRGSGQARARGRPRGGRGRGACRDAQGAGWWAPTRGPPPAQQALSQDTLNKILLRLLTDFRVGTRNVYCCLARKHCAINDARRRIAAQLGRKYSGDRLIHSCQLSDCNCCCVHLLESGREQIAKDMKTLDKQIQAILGVETTSEESSCVDDNIEVQADVTEASTAEDEVPFIDGRLQNRSERDATRTEVEKRDAAEKDAVKVPEKKPGPKKIVDDEKRKLLLLKKRERRQKLKKQKQVEQEQQATPVPADQNDVYKDWIRERNLASEVFGFKPPPKFTMNKLKPKVDGKVPEVASMFYPTKAETSACTPVETVNEVVENRKRKIIVTVPEDKLQDFLKNTQKLPTIPPKSNLTKGNVAKFNHQQTHALESFNISDSDDEPSLTIDENQRNDNTRKTDSLGQNEYLGQNENLGQNYNMDQRNELVKNITSDVTLKIIESDVQTQNASLLSCEETLLSEDELTPSLLNPEDNSSDCVEIQSNENTEETAVENPTMSLTSLPIAIPGLQVPGQPYTITLPAGSIVTNSPGKMIPVSIAESTGTNGNQTVSPGKTVQGPIMMLNQDGQFVPLFMVNTPSAAPGTVEQAASSALKFPARAGSGKNMTQNQSLQFNTSRVAATQKNSLQTPTVQTTTWFPSSAQTSTVQTSAVQTSTVQTSTVQTSTVQTSTVQTSTVQTSTVQTSTVQTSTVHTSTVQTAILQATTPQTPAVKVVEGSVVAARRRDYVQFFQAGDRGAGVEKVIECVAQYVQGKDPTKLQVLQIDVTQSLWKLTEDTVVVTEVDLPCGQSEVWSMGPRHRWLDLSGSPGTTTMSVSAPARVSLDDKLYFKLRDQPLIYAQALTLVPDMGEVRRLMLSNSKLLLYHRDTAKLTQLRTVISDKMPRRIAVYCDGAKQALANLVRGLNIIVTKRNTASTTPTAKPTVTSTATLSHEEPVRYDPIIILDSDSDSDYEPLAKKSTEKTRTQPKHDMAPKSTQIEPFIKRKVLEGLPKSTEAQPNTIGAKRRVCEGPPKSTETQPNTIVLKRKVCEGLPKSTEAQPNTIGAKRRVCEGPPKSTETQPNTIGAKTKVCKDLPKSAETQPNTIGAKRKVCEGIPKSTEPQPINISPQRKVCEEPPKSTQPQPSTISPQKKVVEGPPESTEATRSLLKRNITEERPLRRIAPAPEKPKSTTKQSPTLATNKSQAIVVRKIIRTGNSPSVPGNVINVVASTATAYKTTPQGSIIKLNEETNKPKPTLPGTLRALIQNNPDGKPIKIILGTTNSILKTPPKLVWKSTSVTAEKVAEDKKAANETNENNDEAQLISEKGRLKQKYDEATNTEQAVRDSEPMDQDAAPSAVDTVPMVAEEEIVEQDIETAEPELSDEEDFAILGL